MLKQSTEDVAAAEKALAELARFADRFGPQALWQAPDPSAVEREKAESDAIAVEEEKTRRIKEAQAARSGALLLREFSASTYLSPIAKPAFGATVPPASLQLYRTRLLADAHIQDDPIGVMLVEHYVLLF